MRRRGRLRALTRRGSPWRVVMRRRDRLRVLTRRRLRGGWRCGGGVVGGVAAASSWRVRCGGASSRRCGRQSPDGGVAARRDVWAGGGAEAPSGGVAAGGDAAASARLFVAGGGAEALAGGVAADGGADAPAAGFAAGAGAEARAAVDAAVAGGGTASPVVAGRDDLAVGSARARRSWSAAPPCRQRTPSRSRDAARCAAFASRAVRRRAAPRRPPRTRRPRGASRALPPRRFWWRSESWRQAPWPPRASGVGGSAGAALAAAGRGGGGGSAAALAVVVGGGSAATGGGLGGGARRGGGRRLGGTARPGGGPLSAGALDAAVGLPAGVVAVTAGGVLGPLRAALPAGRGERAVGRRRAARRGWARSPRVSLRGRGVIGAAGSLPPGVGRSRMTSGETSRRVSVTLVWSPRQAKAAVQRSSVSAAQGLWSRTAIRRRRLPSTRRCSVGRTKRRPRTPNQRPVTSRRSEAVHSKRSTSNASSVRGSAGVSIRAIDDPSTHPGRTCCLTACG